MPQRQAMQNESCPDCKVSAALKGITAGAHCQRCNNGVSKQCASEECFEYFFGDGAYCGACVQSDPVKSAKLRLDRGPRRAVARGTRLG